MNKWAKNWIKQSQNINRIQNQEEAMHSNKNICYVAVPILILIFFVSYDLNLHWLLFFRWSWRIKVLHWYIQLQFSFYCQKLILWIINFAPVFFKNRMGRQSHKGAINSKIVHFLFFYIKWTVLRGRVDLLCLVTE